MDMEGREVLSVLDVGLTWTMIISIFAISCSLDKEGKQNQCTEPQWGLFCLIAKPLFNSSFLLSHSDSFFLEEGWD